MHAKYWTTAILLLTFISMVTGHARIKHPRPLAAAPDNSSGFYYNAPLWADGSNFPCKGLHKRRDVDRTPIETWQAGQQARFEILADGATDGVGNLAAHSGGSCQASLSFDNGETWKVLHSYIGGCPRGAAYASNIAGPNQTFTFLVPKNTKAGDALFSWSWIAVTGNRNEYYQNCASVRIAGTGTSTLDDLPDMFLGDMTIEGHIGPGECRSNHAYALNYPNPGEARTITEVRPIPFKRPTGGKCYTKASGNSSTGSAKKQECLEMLENTHLPTPDLVPGRQFSTVVECQVWCDLMPKCISWNYYPTASDDFKAGSCFLKTGPRGDKAAGPRPGALAGYCDAKQKNALVPLYRYYSPSTQDHLYTTDANEIGTIVPWTWGAFGYLSEGNVGRIYDSTLSRPANTVPFYRYVNTHSKQHFYTVDWQEIGTNVVGATVGHWKHEGITGYIYSNSQTYTRPLFRYYQPSNGYYFYTPNSNDMGTETPGAAGKYGFVFQGIAGYVV